LWTFVYRGVYTTLHCLAVPAGARMSSGVRAEEM
jgi:hypothetical protein